MSQDEDVSVKFDRIKTETTNAFLIIIDNKSVWLPKSQIRMYRKKKKVYMPEWLAHDKELI